MLLSIVTTAFIADFTFKFSYFYTDLSSTVCHQTTSLASTNNSFALITATQI